MKKVMYSIFFSFLAATCFGQHKEIIITEQQRRQQSQAFRPVVPEWRKERASICVGALMGGGGLIGADLEFLVGKRAGLQLGAGLASMGLGINDVCIPYQKSIPVWDRFRYDTIQRYSMGKGMGKCKEQTDGECCFALQRRSELSNKFEMTT